MKKFWVNVGKAAAYFGGYFGGQLVVSFAASFVISMIVSATMVAKNGALDMEAYTEKVMEVFNSAMSLILIIAGLLSILVFFIVAKIRKKKFAESAGLKKFKAVTVAPIIIGGIALNFVLSFLMSAIPFPEKWIESYETSVGQVLTGAGIVMWIAVVIMAPLVEELTFRGFMYTRLKQGMPKWIAVIVSSLAFGIMHGNIIQGLYTFIFGFTLVYVLERTKSTWASIIFHMAFNFVGAVMSTWPTVGEILDNVWVVIVSFVLTIGMAVWFILATKGVKDEETEEEKTIAEAE